MGIYDDVLDTYDNVVKKLNTDYGPNVLSVKQDYVALGDEWDLGPDGEIMPTAIIGAPGLASTGRYGRSMAGAAHSLMRARFDILCVAATRRASIKVMGMVTQSLVGYQPGDGTGEIVLIPSVMLNPAQQTGAPTRFAIPVGFTLSMNAIVIT